MTHYSQEFKDNIIQQMLPPVSNSVRQFHNETGVSEQTLYKWKREPRLLVWQHHRVAAHPRPGPVKISF